jgi:hypothetical protein
VTSTVSRSVTPGAWYGVLGDDVLVLLPPTAKARVATLWETVDEGAGFDEVLDALISGGLRDLPGFVLVSSVAGDVKVVIRGAGEAELTTADGPVTVSGSADTTWVERHVSGVTAMRLEVADGEGTPYTVGSGLVRVAVVEQPAGAAEASEPDEADAEGRVPTHLAPVAEPDPPPAPEPTTEHGPEPVPEPAVPAEPAAPAWAPVPPPVYVPPVPVTPSVAAPPVPVTPPVPAPAVVVPTPAEPEPEPADTGDTQSQAFDPGRFASPPDGIAGTPQAPAVAARPVARLIFSSGEVVDVDRAILVGRAPEARRFGGDEQARTITVPSPQQEISSTHLEIRPGAGADHGSAVATDLGSTNGTVVVQPGLPPEDLQPGIAVQLIPGAVVDLGEGVTIQVTTV